MRCYLLLSSAVLGASSLLGCTGNGPRDAGPERWVIDLDTGTDAGMDASDRDVRDVVDAVDVQPYDAGPPPTCSILPMARRVLDQPGGTTIAPPAALVEVGGGFLTAYRHTEGSGTPTRDSVDVIALGGDGTPRGAPRIVLDGLANNAITDTPSLVSTNLGAFLTAQQSRAPVTRPDFILQLFGAVVASDGTGDPAFLLRDRYTRSLLTTYRRGGILGLSTVIRGGGDAGVAVASPVSFLLESDGGTRSPDRDLLSALPDERFDSVIRTMDNDQAVLAYRTVNRLGITRIDSQGAFDPRMYLVANVTLPTIDDAATVADALLIGWSRTLAGGVAEVHAVVVDPATLRARADLLLETFTGEGFTTVSVTRGYGGAVYAWRRGVDANARVRIAVVSPDGRVVVPPTDLTRAPNIEGKLAIVAAGRQVSFLAQDGLTTSTWGYTFGRGCIPVQ